MLIPAHHRHLLGAFLRTHREALSPVRAGVRESGRRRTPGLRREEVASLSGFSTTWYSWLEQGRDIAVSEAALARLAVALQLSSAERAYLFELSRRRDPSPSASASPSMNAPPDLVAALQAITGPAYLLDRLWNVRSWNMAAARLFAPWFASGETNLLRFVFLDPEARRFLRDWDDRARRVLAEFRADTAHDPNDSAMQALVRELRDRSPAFSRLWISHAVLAREGGLRLFDHPDDGPLAYTQITLVPATHPGHKLVILVPPPGSDPR